MNKKIIGGLIMGVAVFIFTLVYFLIDSDSSGINDFVEVNQYLHKLIFNLDSHDIDLLFDHDTLFDQAKKNSSLNVQVLITSNRIQTLSRST
jgi:hypothetical protein